VSSRRRQRAVAHSSSRRPLHCEYLRSGVVRKNSIRGFSTQCNIVASAVATMNLQRDRVSPTDRALSLSVWSFCVRKDPPVVSSRRLVLTLGDLRSPAKGQLLQSSPFHPRYPNDWPSGFVRRANEPQSTDVNEPGAAAATAAAIFPRCPLIMGHSIADSVTIASFLPERFCSYRIDWSPVKRTSKPASSAVLRSSPFFQASPTHVVDRGSFMPRQVYPRRSSSIRTRI
jgi:hypothetical protein